MKFTRVTTEADLVRWHGVWQAAMAQDFDALPADPIEDLRPALVGPMAGDDTQLWLASDSGQPVGAAQLRLPLLDNLGLAMIAVFIHPDHRRRGHGRRVSTAALAVARDAGRTDVLVEVPSRTRDDDPAPGVALARSMGARPLHAETRRVLDVASVTDAALDSLHASAASAAAGYSTVGWRDHAPEKYVEDMAALLALMSTDPPQGELTLEPEVWDAKRFREHEGSILARRREHLTIGVRDDDSGRLIAFSDLGVPTGRVEVGYQWSTIDAGEHRGHRLGMLAKVANLRQLRETMPYVRYLNTWNADENTHMVSVNEALGFRPIESWHEWGLAIGGSATAIEHESRRATI
jgi:GNAT superfamily N-acetyltransferase